MTEEKITKEGKSEHERSILERLFRIGGGVFLTSITYIATWFVLGLILGNTAISEVFSLTYPIQFLSTLLISVFGTGANIKKEREGNQNAVGSGQLFGFALSLAMCVVLLVFSEEYIAFFSLDLALFKPYTMYYFALLFVQTNFNLVLERLYFEDREKLANRLTLAFNLIAFCLVVLLTLATKNFVISASITFCTLFVFWAVVVIWQFKKFKPDFNILSNMKYESSQMIYCIFMFVTYFVGIGIVFSSGEEYAAAFNFVTLCTDAQWDCATAVKTVAKIDIAKDRLKFRKLVKSAYIFVSVIVSTSVVLFFSLFSLFEIVLVLGLAYLGIEVVHFFVFTYCDVMFCVTQLQFSFAINSIFYFLFKTIRALLSCLIMSPFGTSIGQLTDVWLLLIFYLFIRFCFFKLDGEKLVRKRKIEKAESVA